MKLLEWLKTVEDRAKKAMPAPWTVQLRGWDSPDFEVDDPDDFDEDEEEGCEAVIHLSDRSRGWDSWGWGNLDRIIVYDNSDISKKERPKAKANVEFIAHAREDVPKLVTSLIEHIYFVKACESCKSAEELHDFVVNHADKLSTDY